MPLVTHSARFLQLNGLRAFAVLSVIASHSLTKNPLGGWGVRLSFVLSGFLITHILLRACEQTDNHGPLLRAFYARRSLRIFPAYYVALLIAVALNMETLREQFWWYATYATNVLKAREGLHMSSAAHLWSLAVEEQFYLCWPWLIVFASPQTRRRTVIACLIVPPLLRAWATAIGEPLWGVVLTPMLLDGLALGGLFALGLTRRTVNVYAGLGLLVLGLSATVLPILSLLHGSAANGVCLWLVAGAVRGFTGPFGKVLMLRAVQYVGNISYGIYLVHYFVPETVRIVERTFDIWLRFPQRGWAQFAYTASASLIMAILSWHLIEAPVNRLKRHFPYVRREDRNEQVA